MSFKIHPGIGVARVGDSPTDWFLGPETIEIPDPPAGGFRDASCKLKKQGARFRVFLHDDAPGSDVVAEAKFPDYTITWTVTLRKQQGPALVESTQSITGPNASVDLPTITIVGGDETIGSLRTDAEGRLIVLSGDPKAYYDASCEGSVSAVVAGPGGGVALASWVVITAPDFTPGRRSIISNADSMYQHCAARGMFGLSYAGLPIPSFRKDIFPILRARNAGRPLAASVESRFPLLADAAERASIANIPSADPTVPPPPPSTSVIGDITLVQWKVLNSWIQGLPGVSFIDDWTLGGEFEPSYADLDRGPVSHIGSWDSRGVSASWFDPATLNVAEPFRLVATPANFNFIPTFNWADDLAICVGIPSWVDAVESPEIPPAGGSWQARGFMVLQGNDLAYVERCAHAYVLQITHALHFGTVAPGPGGAAASISLPIVFEVIASPTDAVTLTLTVPLPGGLSTTAASVTVPAGMSQTVKLWLTYNTLAVGASLSDVVHVEGPDGMTYDVTVDGVTGTMPETSKVAFVLDCSYSMTENRGDGPSKMAGLQAAFDVLAEAVRLNDGVGIVPFSTDPIEPAKEVTLVTDDTVRDELKDYVGLLTPLASTSIGDGLVRARTLLSTAIGSYTHQSIVVITDGKETEAQYIADVSSTIDARTFAIGIGQADNINAGTLQTLTGNRGGYLLITGDPVSVNNQFTLEKYLLQILAGVQNEEVIVDPEGSVYPGQVERIAIPITEAEFDFSAFVVADDPKALAVALRTPDGALITAEELAALPGASVSRGARVVSLRVALPLLFAAQRHGPGTWSLLIAQRPTWHDESHASFAARPAAQPAYGKPERFAAVVSARSALKFRLTAQQTDLRPGSAVLFDATLTAFGAPLAHEVGVSAEIIDPTGRAYSVPLIMQEPGRFLARHELGALGTHRVRVRATGRSPRFERFQREHAVTLPVVAELSRPQGSLIERCFAELCGGDSDEPRAPRIKAWLQRCARRLRTRHAARRP